MSELRTLVESCKFRLGDAHPVDDRVGMREEDDACPRERDRPGATRAIDQPLAREALERRNLMADRRLDVPKAKCGAPEGAFLCNRMQRNEVPQLDA